MSRSMAAADFDLDGDLDVFVCGYFQRANSLGLGHPLPYHDANNGARNSLLVDGGDWNFSDEAWDRGLWKNGTRFSYAAAWEDYDLDGDMDLYVANDFGRNNLYRNDNARFTDVAAELGVEDISAGMSVSWGDWNRDGRSDIYISNMFSSAGNRVTYQRQFKTGVGQATKGQFQRHARGNTLFQSQTDGSYLDVSEEAGVTMGRWAWSSRLVDLNNDGWDDIFVGNGAITGKQSDDL